MLTQTYTYTPIDYVDIALPIFTYVETLFDSTYGGGLIIIIGYIFIPDSQPINNIEKPPGHITNVCGTIFIYFI